MVEKLTEKQQAFLDHLKADPKRRIGKAYMAVYRCKNLTSARAAASRLIKSKPEIQKQLDLHHQILAQKSEMDQESILHELSCIGFSDISDVIEQHSDGSIDVKDFAYLPDDVSKAVQDVEVEKSTEHTDKGAVVTKKHIKIKMHSKIPALQLASEILGIRNKKQKGSGRKTLVFPIQYVNQTIAQHGTDKKASDKIIECSCDDGGNDS